ncbi:MAG: hypothetical protein ACREX8_12130 [Gammaproteobacteria bacterium]
MHPYVPETLQVAKARGLTWCVANHFEPDGHLSMGWSLFTAARWCKGGKYKDRMWAYVRVYIRQ